MSYIGNVNAFESVGTSDLEDGAVTAAKVADDVATQAELDLKAPLASPSFTGNVGIGTSSELAPLSVASSDAVTMKLTKLNTPATTGNVGAAIEFNHSQNATDGADGESTSAIIKALPKSAWGGDLTFSTKSANGTPTNAPTERMRIDDSGNVGIGTSSPLAALTIGNNSADGTVDYTQGIVLTDTASGVPWVHAGIVATGSTSYNGSLIFATDGNATRSPDTSGLTERMRIDSSGNVSFGDPLTVIQLIANGVQGVGIDGPNGVLAASRFNDLCAIFKRENSNGPAVNFMRDGSIVGYISVTTSATSYNTSSDYRLKEADVPMTGATERVKALRPINFAWKVDGSRVDGFFAHEVAEVVPEAATGTKDAMMDEEYEVTPATETTEAVMGTRSVPDMQGIDQSKLVPLLTATIQELIARIETLEGK